MSINGASFRAVCPPENDHPPIIGEVQYSLGDRSAYLNYLLPKPPSSHPGLCALLDLLTLHAGEMGATNLLAEAEESDPVVDVLRKVGFIVYGWESIWKVPSSFNSFVDEEDQGWERPSPSDENAARTLYQTLVPPIVQVAEPFPTGDTQRLVYQRKGEIVAYAECVFGSKGIYLKPIIHPSIDQPYQMLVELIQLFKEAGRDIYIQMRSYQAWLAGPLEQMEATTTVHFTLLVRHLAVTQYSPATAHRLSLENRQAESTMPFLQNFKGQK